jgi:hypothetical protein
VKDDGIITSKTSHDNLANSRAGKQERVVKTPLQVLYQDLGCLCSVRVYSHDTKLQDADDADDADIRRKHGKLTAT